MRRKDELKREADANLTYYAGVKQDETQAWRCVGRIGHGLGHTYQYVASSWWLCDSRQPEPVPDWQAEECREDALADIETDDDDN